MWTAHMRDRFAPPTARPSPPPGAPPPHPSPLLPLRPSPRLRHRHWRGSSWRLESPRSTSPCRRTAAAGSATRSPAPQSPSAPAPDGAPAPRGVTEEDLAGRAPCRPHSPPPPRRPPHRSPSPPTAQPSPPPCGSIPSMAQCACLTLGCPFHLWVWLGASLRQAWLIDPRGPDGLGPAVLLPPTNHPPLSIPNHSNNTTHPSPNYISTPRTTLVACLHS